MTHLSLDSPVGGLTVWAEDGAVTRVDWGRRADDADPPAVLDKARRQLQDYFAGRRQDFDLPLRPCGNAFQQAFYAALCAIEFGQTRTYGDLAADLGVSAQAVGQACGANPIPILIP
nr:methylated-DNA--[protein]-cysteine S-methyltransferase [Rhodobacter sp.]